MNCKQILDSIQRERYMDKKFLSYESQHSQLVYMKGKKQANWFLVISQMAGKLLKSVRLKHFAFTSYQVDIEAQMRKDRCCLSVALLLPAGFKSGGLAYSRF